MERSEQLNELAAALAKCQGQVKDAEKSAKLTTKHFSVRYSTLADLWEACRKPLSDNGLSVAQFTAQGEPGTVRLVSMLLHTSGQYLCPDPLEIPVSAHDAQGYGSALTYARRYGLAALVGVCPDADDDGQAANAPQERRQEPQPRPQAQPESRGDQGAQRARAAVQAQEQPAASLVDGQTPDALPGTEAPTVAQLRVEMGKLLGTCERLGLGDPAQLQTAHRWLESDHLTPETAAKVNGYLLGCLNKKGVKA